jgi:hypothetical protein
MSSDGTSQAKEIGFIEKKAEKKAETKNKRQIGYSVIF